MLDKLKKTFKHTAIYSIGNMSTKLIGLILLPLYTDYLTPADYGILSIFEITSQFLVATLGLRLSGAMMRWFATERDDKRKRSIIFNTYAAVLTIMLVFLALTLPFNTEIAQFSFGHDRYASYFTILFFWVAFDVINRVTLDLIRVYERSMFYMILTVLKFTSILGLNIYFVAFLELGVEGIILGQALGNLLILLAAVPFFVPKMWGGRFSFVLFREMAAYGVPLIFSTISTMILTLSDRYILKYLTSDYHVGIYSLAYKIAGVINLFIIQSFQLGFLPIAYKMFDQKGAKDFFAKVLTYFVFVLFMAALVISFFSKEVIILFASNKEYYIAYTVVPLLSLGFILRGVNYVFSLSLHYVKRTKFNAYIISLAALINIILNFVLIPYLGIFGAAITTILSNYVMVQLFYYYAQKFYPVKYELKRVFLLFLIGLAWLLGGYLIDTRLDFFWLAVIAKLFLLVAFPFILKVTGFYHKVEIETISRVWKSWRNPRQLKANLKRLSESDKEEDE